MARFKSSDLNQLADRRAGQQTTLALPHSAATATVTAPPGPALTSALVELVSVALRNSLVLPTGMRALSLLQPWASLVAWGLKHLETRSWSTAYRGPLGIHASLGKPRHVRILCEHDEFMQRALAQLSMTFDELPRGGLVAVASMQLCRRIVPEGAHAGLAFTNARELDPARLPPEEYAFGDYSPGRFAWELVDVLRLAEPVPARGMLQLWEIPADVRSQLQNAIRVQP